MKRYLGILTLVAALASFAGGAFAQNATASSVLESRTVWLDELDLSAIRCGWKNALACHTDEGGPISLGGEAFERGVGWHAPGSFAVELPETGSVRFLAQFGVDDDAGENGDVEILAYADGELLWRSGVSKWKDAPKSIELDLTGRRWFVLIADVGGDDYFGDHADLGDARFEISDAPDDSVAPRLVRAEITSDGVVLDRSDEAALEFFAIEDQMKTDVEKIRNDYLNSANATGYNGSLGFMTPPPSGTVASQALDPNANIFESDRDPLDVLIRRTRALLDCLRADADDESFLDDEAQTLATLEETAKTLPLDEKAKRFATFREALALRRAISLKNPILDFSDILFVKRFPCDPDETKGNHMCDQFFGFNALPGGGLFVLKNAFSDKPLAVDLLKDVPVVAGKYADVSAPQNAGKPLDSTWGFLSPELSFDGTQILFAATDTKSPRSTFEWRPDNVFHLFRCDFDPQTLAVSNLTQLTDGSANDFDPCFLPNGRIAFISERRGGYGRCHPRIVPTYTLFSINADGSDVVQLSAHETNEWQPAVDADGQIIYTRWDYVDRGANNAHSPWITTPDGCDPRALVANYNTSAFFRPVFEGNIRPIPGDSGKITATAAAHHGQVYGSLLSIDLRVQDDDGMGPLRRITPEQLFPEAETPQHAAPARYATCYPLSELFFLCVYDPTARGDSSPTSSNYGIYLIDAFGNRTLLYRDPEISCLDPIPIRAVETPPIVPRRTLVGKPLAPGEEYVPIAPETLPKTAEIALVDVYDSTHPFPKDVKIKRLRIVQLLPKTTWRDSDPLIGYGHQKGARQVLGTVPVEDDGSAYFKVPVDVPIYFQALDENGVAIQSMRSDAYVHPGERLVCQGCHENRHEAAPQLVARNCKATRRAPSEIEPDPDGTKPTNYPRLIQPILDKKCVDCHAKEAANGNAKAIDLSRGPKGKHFFNSFENLRPYCFYFNHYLWTEPQTLPGQFGSLASPLYKNVLTKEHFGLELTPEELYRFTVWLDNNCDFYGNYEECERQRKGEVIPPKLE